MLTLSKLARALAGEVSGGQVLCPGPGHSPRDRSLSVRLSATAPDGFVVHSFAGDDWRECRDHVSERLGPAAQRRSPLPQCGVAQTRKRVPAGRDTRARWLWSQRQPILRSIAERYLREPRGYLGPIPATLGYLPPRGERGPAMIAVCGLTTEPEPEVLAIADEDVRAVHLTHLLPDGSDRTGKIMVGKGAQGFPIVLAPNNDGLALAITEGIEDALSIHAALGIGVWAAGSAPFLPALAPKVPPFVEVVHVFGHRDGGERFARVLSGRLHVLGFKVVLKFVEGRP